MEVSEEIRCGREVINAFLKAKKTLRIYPSNNPMYVKTVEESYRKLREFFDLQDELKLRIKQNDFYLDTDAIYHNPGKEDNLALFFFKDGLRDITFGRDISMEELQEFLEVLAFDFDREGIDDDVVTLLWEKDFKNIKYVIDEAVLTEDEEYEDEAVRHVKGTVADEDDLKKAYEDAIHAAEEVKEVTLISITDKDLKTLTKYIEADTYDRKDKLIGILYETLYHAEPHEYEAIVRVLCDAVKFSITHGDIASAVSILKEASELSSGASVPEELKRHMGSIFIFASSMELMKMIGEFLDTDTQVNEDPFNDYAGFLTKDAIGPLMAVLGEMKTIGARKAVINALVTIGSKDITALAKGLKDDRWYVVRNIIYILRRIGDKRAVEHLTKALKHEDIRVRKEVLTTLGELGSPQVVQTIKECMDDPESSIRLSAVRALAHLGSEQAKRILLDRVSDKHFLNTEFSEKKEYFENLAHWKDNEVFDFFMNTIKKTPFFKRAKYNENRACAAYSLGIIANKDSLPALYKLRESKNKLLSEYAYSAIRRIEYGR